MFHQRLDNLMKTLQISNNQLAKHLCLDASLISRWRTGKRTPPKNSTYIQKIACYFCEHAKMDYQKAAMCEIIGIPSIPSKNDAQLSQLLYSWLCCDMVPDSKIIDKLISNIGTLNAHDSFAENTSDIPWSNNIPKGSPMHCEVFYGMSGKQKSVSTFLYQVLKSSIPCTLLLYSDEDIGWISSDREFTIEFINLLREVIKKKNKIKIIHTLSRDMSEMFSAIDFWLPLYITGSVEPYFCPKYKEHYFKRTMFIAPGTAAVVSTTLSGCEQNAPNILSMDQEFIDSLSYEFEQYLSICRPLMNIFTSEHIAEYSKIKNEFEKHSADCFVLSDTLTLVTMPEDVYADIYMPSISSVKAKQRILSDFKTRCRFFESNIQKNKYIEIISLPSLEEARAGNAHASLCPVPLTNSVHQINPSAYNADSYKKHVRHIIKLLTKYDNYNLYICRKNLINDVTLNVKDDTGVIVEKTTPPFSAFAFSHQNMTNAFYYYVQDFINSIPHSERNKKSVIDKLKILVDEQ